MSLCSSVLQQCSDVESRVNARMQAIRKEVDAIAELLDAQPAQQTVAVAAAADKRPTVCLMCNQPYGAVGGQSVSCYHIIVAHCGCRGYGKACTQGGGCFCDGSPCHLNSIVNDCYKCR